MRIRENEAAELYREKAADPNHLDEALLLRAGSGDLTEGQRQGVVAHVALCSECARQYQIARAMRPIGQEWREDSPRRLSPAWFAVAAAVVMVAALGWLIVLQQRSQTTIEQLRRQLASQRPVEPMKPQVGVPIVDLDADVTRGAGESESEIVVPPTANVFTLILHLPHDPGQSRVLIDIANASHAPVWHHSATVDPHSSSITLLLHRDLIPGGAYVIHVESATFRFRVTYQ